MKVRAERAMSGVRTLVRNMFAPAMLKENVYKTDAAMIFRMDGRDITEIAEDGGYTGREFSGTVREARNYLLCNLPKIGYGGCVELLPALTFAEGREPLNVHIHITCPTNNRVINMPMVILGYGIGDYSPEPGSNSLSAHALLKEQEHVTLNSVSMRQFLGSVSKDHIQLLKDGMVVPNQLRITGVDESAPEIIRLEDCSNTTSMMLACLRQGCVDKATVIATKLEAERVLKEADKNAYSNKTKQQLVGFWNAANPSKDLFRIPEDPGFSVAVTKA